MNLSDSPDIIDIDHLVPTMSDFTSFLGPYQVFSGKADPVTIIQDGTPGKINMNAFALAAKESYKGE